MDYRVEITPSAEQDLDAILTYLHEELTSPLAAEDFLEKVEACCGRLVEQPALYERCRNERLASLGYRRAVINHYVMIYRIEEEAETVYVLRFFYGPRDYEKYL